jgi:hypothetical protein
MSASSRETSTWSNRSQLQCDFFIIRKIFKNKKTVLTYQVCFSLIQCPPCFKNVCTTFLISSPLLQKKGTIVLFFSLT